MDNLTSIRAQIDAVRLPLYAVTVTAVRRPDTPLLLMLHWHGFRRDEAAGPAPARRCAVPGSAVQLNPRWRALEEVEGAMLDAAWQLGAWDLERSVRRGCNDVGASAREAHECRQAFGDNPLAPGSEAHLVAEAPDRDVLRLQEELSDTLGAPVEIRTSRSGGGKIQIQFADLDQLDGILQRLR